MTNKKAKGKRKKSRSKMRNRAPKLTVNKLLAKFDNEQTVQIDINSSIAGSGMPPTRTQGRVGVIKRKQGKAYLVEVKGNKKNINYLIIPAHLKLLKVFEEKTTN